MADSLHYMGQGQYCAKRWTELIEQAAQPPKPERTGDEIAFEVITRAGLKFRG